MTARPLHQRPALRGTFYHNESPSNAIDVKLSSLYTRTKAMHVTCQVWSRREVKCFKWPWSLASIISAWALAEEKANRKDALWLAPLCDLDEGVGLHLRLTLTCREYMGNDRLLAAITFLGGNKARGTTMSLESMRSHVCNAVRHKMGRLQQRNVWRSTDNWHNS